MTLEGPPGPPEQSVAVVVVAWNCAEVISRCLESLSRWSAAWIAEVVVVDAASTDNTVAIVRANFPGARVLQLSGNAGFARAANIGWSHSHVPYIFLLNPDAALCNDAIGGVLAELHDAPKIGVAAPQVLDASGRVETFAARELPSLWHAAVRVIGLRRVLSRVGLLQGETAQIDRTAAFQPVPFLSGTALLLRRSDLECFGGLDETLPMYYEDVELSSRYAARGALRVVVPRALVRHEGAYSSSRSARRLLLLAMEGGQAPYLYIRGKNGKIASALFAGVVGTTSAAQFAGLWLTNLVRRRRPAASTRLLRCRALVGWAVSDKARFTRRARAAFDVEARIVADLAPKSPTIAAKSD